MIRGQRLAVNASRLAPCVRRTGVTWAGCEIWSELVRGVRRRSYVLAARACGGDGLVALLTSGSVSAGKEVQALQK